MEQTGKEFGIGGMLSSFRRLIRGKKKITFIGCPGWCNPFAELLGYVFRDAGNEMVFIPNLRKDIAANVEMTEYGMQIGKKADPGTDTVVLLGGLAMPKMEINAEAINTMIGEITRGYPDPQIIGVCVGGVFQKAGWDKLIKFDHLIDANMDVVTYSQMKR